MSGSSRLLELEGELSRLSRELDETTAEKVQAAQYGMSLLQQNATLSAKLAELEEAYEVSPPTTPPFTTIHLLLTFLLFF